MKLIQSTDRLLNQFQTNVREVLEPIAQNPIVQGQLLSNVILKTGITNVIPTGLNRNLIGWIITRLNADSVIWDSQDINSTPNQNLQLLCSADCIISLYVF